MQSVVHVTQSVSRLAGGLFESVRHLSKSVQSATGGQLAVISVEDAMTEMDRKEWTPVALRTHPTWGPRLFGYSPRLAADLDGVSPALVHLHGLWRHTSLAVWRWARRTGRPYVVSPHGMLELWALRQSALKKRLARILDQGHCLAGAACLRATSASEVESIRRFGCRKPIALVPNGVEVPALRPGRRLESVAASRRALFLSRIHPKKGLLNLIEAWSQVRPTGWQLDVVGPDEGGHWAQVQARIRSHGLEDQVVYQGEAWNGARTQRYFDSELLVLPSFSENFGLAIAEALSCGVPVITTQATPWKELAEQRCGWWVGLRVEALAGALAEAVASPRGELREMGLRGRKLIESKYTWGPIGRKMVEVYEWMLEKRERPECVVMGQ